MANNNIEQYLEAMLAALDGDTVPDVPSPSWNIEKYLAAILTKLSSGGGSGGGVLVASMNLETMTLNKTWQEIHDAVLNGGAVLQIEAMEVAAPLSAGKNNGTYTVSIVTDKVLILSTDSANGYPVLQQ